MLQMAPALGAAGQLPPCPKSVWRKHAPERNALYLIGRRLGLDVGLLMSNASVSRVRLGSTGPLITVRSDPRDKKTGTLVRREMGRDTYGLLRDEQNGQSESQMIDIGGHVGTTAIFYSLLHPRARVFTFEPAPINVFYLAWNVLANNVSHAVTIYHGGVSSDGREIRLEYSPDDTTSTKNVEMGATWGKLAKEYVAVPTFRLDHLLSTCGTIHADSVRFIKLDCEGCEFDIVPANDNFFRTSRSRIVGEFHFWRAWNARSRKGGAASYQVDLRKHSNGEPKAITATRNALCAHRGGPVHMEKLVCGGGGGS